MIEIIHYKIYNPKLNKFSQGGSYVDRLWSKNGKTWRTLGHLKNHLRMVEDGAKKVLESYLQDECYVLKMVSVVSDTRTSMVDIKEYLK